jgi:hypothetical protein
MSKIDPAIDKDNNASPFASRAMLLIISAPPVTGGHSQSLILVHYEC